MTSPSRRRETDVMKLLMSDWKVEMADDSMAEFYVEFPGPSESPYVGGVWRVHVELPEAYPYKSPSVGFVNKIYHPNVDEGGGSVCLDVINQTWSPMFDLINVFEVFLPQLLLYPNPTDPLNGEAAALLMREPEAYARKVKDYVSRFATRAALDALSARHRGGGGAAHGDAGASNGQGAGANGTVGARDDSSDDGAEDYVSSDDDGDAADDMDDV